MSRSRKKIPIYKDKGLKSSVYNRIFRRVNKQRLHEDKDLKQMRELINGYDICDWTWYDEDNEKLYRK